MHPKFPEEVAYLGGLLRSSRLVKNGEDFEIHMEHEREFLEAVDAVLKNKVGGKYKTEGNRLVIHGADLFDVLVTFFGHPDENGRWALTQEIRDGRLEHRRAFLRGLFDSMGSLDKTLVMKYGWHKDDLKEISGLLADFDVKHSVKGNELHVRDLRTFASRIGTLRPSHEKRLAAVLAG
ncbi:MAG: hypothetical protein HYS81_04070 [Candidatus Aenigmatarchaeota archaeon]|nr:MAG: hypothetical protein HYS81_04070 [Candidatus Aenigmarchaeota archaeon]